MLYIKSTAEFTESNGEVPLPPLKTMLTSVPIIALYTVQLSNSWGYYTVMTSLPTFLNDVHGLSLEQVQQQIRNLVYSILYSIF
jgi:hypothetical protein